MDPKNMSLDELIKRDKTMKKGGAASKFAKGGRNQNRKGGNQGGRPRFENRRGGRRDNNNSFRARRTGNMIGKRQDRGNNFNKVSLFY